MKKLLFLFSIAASLPFFFITVSVTSCDNTPKDSIATKGPICPTALIGTNFYELSLSQTDYQALKDFFNPPPPITPDPNKMLVQFYFNTAKPNLPYLIAYSSQTRNAVTKPSGGGGSDITLSKILTPGKEGIAVPGEFVLGDQQVAFSAIDGLIAGAAVPVGTSYTLIFKPQQNHGEINISYKICVQYTDVTGKLIEYCGGNAGVNTQPSPPANAF